MSRIVYASKGLLTGRSTWTGPRLQDCCSVRPRVERLAIKFETDCAMQQLRRCLAETVLTGSGLTAKQRRRGCASQARELQPQLASLADTRGVLRLAGEGLIEFLQVTSCSCRLWVCCCLATTVSHLLQSLWQCRAY